MAQPKIDPKMPLDIIDIHVNEFVSACLRKDRDYERYIGKGNYLFRLRESIQARLENGFSLSQNNEAASTFWISLLERYERMSDLLGEETPDPVRAMVAISKGVIDESIQEVK